MLLLLRRYIIQASKRACWTGSTREVWHRKQICSWAEDIAASTSNLIAKLQKEDMSECSSSVDPVVPGESPDIFHRIFLPNPSIQVRNENHAFTIVTYNILADCNMRKADYSYTKPKFLDQEFRHKLLMEELRYLDGDIVCMQEVNPSYFENLLESDMISLGYQGAMMKRTFKEYDEGEATFFKTNRFSLLGSHGVSLTELAYKEIEELSLSEPVKEAVQKYLKRADVLFISQLRCCFTDEMITIGNVHIVWDWLKCPDVQCIQVACAIKEIVKRAGSSQSPHVICGDFNSNCLSPAYQLASNGDLNENSLTSLQSVANIELGDKKETLVSHARKMFHHTSSSLTSAYLNAQKHEPNLTTFTGFYHDAVDYVFHNSALKTLGVLETVDAQIIDATGGLPCKTFPSDHVSLKAELLFIE